MECTTDGCNSWAVTLSVDEPAGCGLAGGHAVNAAC